MFTPLSLANVGWIDVLAVWSHVKRNLVLLVTFSDHMIKWRKAYSYPDSLAAYHLQKKPRNFREEVQMVRFIPLENFRKFWKTSNVFLFFHSNHAIDEISNFFACSPTCLFLLCLACPNCSLLSRMCVCMFVLMTFHLLYNMSQSL